MWGETSKERLSPPLSLHTLGLTLDSSLEDAMRALIHFHKDLKGMPQPADPAAAASTPHLRQRRGGCGGDGSLAASTAPGWAPRPLPPREHLLVLLDPGDGSKVKVLGGGGPRRLADLGIVLPPDVTSMAPSADVVNKGESACEGPAMPRLCLATNANAGKRSALHLWRRYCCTRRHRLWLRRRLLRCGRCCGSCSSLLARLVPKRCKERLQPYITQMGFYAMCIRVGLDFVWQDRHEMLRDFRSLVLGDLWSPEGPPPCSVSKIRDELRPFGYALGVGVLYALWDMGKKVAFVQGASMNLTLVE